MADGADGGPGSAEEQLRTPPAGTTPAEPEPPAPPPVTAGQVFRWGVAAALGVLCVALGAYALYTVRGILVLVLIAVFIAVSLDPAVRWLVRRGLGRGVAVTIIFFVVFGLLAVFLFAAIPPLIREGGKLIADLPGYVERITNDSSYQRLAERLHFTGNLSDTVGKLPGRLVGNAWGYTQRFLGALGQILTVLVLTIYFMADLPRLRRGLVRLFPRAGRPRVAQVVNVMVDKVGAYMIGNLIISVIAGVSSFVVLAALGVPYALALAVAVAITDLIPLVGATLGAVLCTAVAFFTTDLWPQTVLVLLFFIAYQQVENYLIVPRIMRNTVDISSLAVLLAALIGATVLGLIGALMAIPLAAAIKVVLTPVIKDMAGPPPPADGGGAEATADAAGEPATTLGA